MLMEGFADESDLLKHELAYVLGQIKHTHALPVLASVLADTQQHAMVRHEAAEALGAIGSLDAVALLDPFQCDPVDVVRDTVLLALDKLRHEPFSPTYHLLLFFINYEVAGTRRLIPLHPLMWK
jgi:deoxyhypusine monooxygenase